MIFTVDLKSNNPTQLCEEFGIGNHSLVSVERNGAFVNPVLKVLQDGAPETIKTVMIGWPGIEADSKHVQAGFSSRALDSKGEFSKDHIFIQVQDVNQADYALEAYWDTETEDPTGQQEDIEVNYLAVPYSIISIASEMISQSDLSDTAEIEIFAINRTQLHRLGFDEVAGKDKVSVGQIRSDGSGVLARLISQLGTDQVIYQLEQQNSSSGFSI